MRLRTGDRLSGRYSNGITTWNFSGRITDIHHDTAGGNFALGRIFLDQPIQDSWGCARDVLMVDLYPDGRLADTRYSDVERIG